MTAATLDLGAPRPLAAPAASAPRRVRVADLLRLALALMITAQLARVPVLSSTAKDAPILLNDLLVVLVVAAGVVAALRGRALVLDRPAGYALAFAAVGGLSALLAIPRFGLSPFQLVFSLAYLARWLVYFGVYLVTVNFVRRADVERVVGTLEGAILAFSAFGIVQSLFLPGFAQIVYPDSRVYVDWDAQGHRLVSTFLDPNFAGAFIVMGLLLGLARLSCGAPVARWKLVLLFAALVLTVSRSAVLALIAGVGVILLVRGLSRRLLRLGGLVGALSVPFLPLIISYAVSFNKFDIDASALTRVVRWLEALVVLADNPVIGVGFNTYGFVRDTYGFGNIGNASFGLDGGLLFIAVMTGGVGVLLYVGMLRAVLRRCRRIWRAVGETTPEERALALGTAACTVALVVHSAFLNSLLYPFLMEPLWVLAGLTFAIAGRGPASEAAAAPPEGFHLVTHPAGV